MTLKNQMAGDLDDGAVWFDADDFADWHEVNDRRVLCELGAMRSRPEKIGRMIGGAWSGSSYIFIRAKDFARAPLPGDQITIDGVLFWAINVMDDCGVYVIEYGRKKDANIRRPNA